MSLYNNFGEESLREGARSTRPPPSYLTLTLTLTLTRMKMYKSDDQMIKSQSHSHSHSQNILILSSSSCCINSCALLSLSQRLDMRAFSSLAQPRDTCLLLFLAASICVRWIVMIPSHDLLFFYSLSRLPKSGQKPPKSAKSSFSRKACVCFSLSFSLRF